MKIMAKFTGQTLTEKIANAMGLLATRCFENAQDMAAKKTGQLRQQIAIQKIDDTTYEIATAVPYANFVEYGTGQWKI